MTKECPTCGPLPKDCFNTRGEHNGKLRTYCRKCENLKNIERYQTLDKSKHRIRAYRHSLKRNYNLSEEQFQQQYKEQNGCCPLCNSKLANIFNGTTGERFAMDHCHQSGQVRQILCFSCNTGLGCFKDNVETMRKATIYLESYR